MTPTVARPAWCPIHQHYKCPCVVKVLFIEPRKV